MSQQLQKRSDWSRLYNFEFAQFEEIVAGDTISSASVPAVVGLTLGTPAISGSQVQLTIAGGTVGATYKVVCTITTAASRILSIEGLLAIF